MDVRILLVFFIWLGGLGVEANPAPETRYILGKGDSCYDGDTCTILASGKILKVRLFGIDAPEYQQDEGRRAQAFTESLIRGKDIKMQCFGNSFERVVCTVYQGRRNINSEVVRQGWAFDFPLYSEGCYRALERRAKQGRLGIWANEGPLISPYCYRHSQLRICHEDRLFMP